MPIERKMSEVDMSVETTYGVAKKQATETCGHAKTEVETMRRYLMDAARMRCSHVDERMLEWERLSSLKDDDVIVEWSKT